MGGKFTSESDLEHTPYTSVRKLFYDNSRDCNQPRRTKQRKSEIFSRLGEWRSSYDEKRPFGDEGVYLQKNRRASDGMFLRPISKSILFRDSYSDFYCEPMKMENSLSQSSWLSRSDNKLNCRSAAGGLGRFRSLDTVKFKSSNLPMSCLKEDEYDIYDDTNSCFKCPIDEEEEDDCRSEGGKELTVQNNGTRDRCVTTEYCRSISNSPSVCWFASLGLWIDNLPWTKRRPRNKERKERKGKNLNNGRRPSNSSDVVRTTKMERESPLLSHSQEDCQDACPRFGNIGEYANFPPQVSSDGNFNDRCGCDGVFGCS